MLPRTDITVRPVGKVEQVASLEVVGDARQEAFQRSLAGLVGKSMQAEVLSKLTDGSYLVKVAGSSARMMLPPGAEVGTEVPLTLTALNPRPTFQLASAQPGATVVALVYSEAHPAIPAAAALADPAKPGVPLLPAPDAAPQPPAGAMTAARSGPATGAVLSHAASLLGKAPLIPADQLPELDHDSAAPTLSAAARALASVLASAASAGSARTAIVAPAPLASAATIEPAKLAAALKDAIGNSGLFYESHLAEWSAGSRPLAELAREPQMQRALSPVPPDAGPNKPVAPADPATAQFINLQLSSQEQGRVAWQGQLWPGQPLQWQISKDAPQGGGGNGDTGEPAPAWRSALRFRFPLLGEIAATVVMAGDQLHIQVQAGSDEVRGLLRAGAGELSSALEAAGTPLSSLTIGAQPGATDG
jgi:hypothetical protein